METAGAKSSPSGGATKRTQDTTTSGTMAPVTTTPSGGGGGNETASTTTSSDGIDGEKGHGNDKNNGKDSLRDALGNSAAAAADSDRGGSTFAVTASVEAETATAVDTLMAAARGQINHSSRVVSTGSDPCLSPARPRGIKAMTAIAMGAGDGSTAVATVEASAAAAATDAASAGGSGGNNIVSPTAATATDAGSTATATTGRNAPIDPSTWPRINVATPHANDVLCGRGGGTNNHLGNEHFRDLVSSKKLEYINSSKREKPLVSRSIVDAVRRQNPPGRFLQRDDVTGLWSDIGDQRAREKTSQALREGAPNIRKEIGVVDKEIGGGGFHGAVGGAAAGGSGGRSVSGGSAAAAGTGAAGGPADDGEAEGGRTVGHHSPPPLPIPQSSTSAAVDTISIRMDGTVTAVAGRSRGRHRYKPIAPKPSVAPGSSEKSSPPSVTLQRPRSLGAAQQQQQQRGVSAPIYPYAAIPPASAHYGSSGRGGMINRGLSVPSQYGTSYDGGPAAAAYYYPRQYPGAGVTSAAQPPPRMAARWVAGGTSGGGGGGGASAPLAATSTATGSTLKRSTAGATPTGRAGPVVSDDVQRRLLLSEWLSGGIVVADARQEQKRRSIEAEADAYRTAGLMGIDPDVIVKRVEGGKEDIIAIVESFKNETAALPGDNNDKSGEESADKVGGDQAVRKRRRLNIGDWSNDSSDSPSSSKRGSSETKKRIEDALGSIGAF